MGPEGFEFEGCRVTHTTSLDTEVKSFTIYSSSVNVSLHARTERRVLVL